MPEAKLDKERAKQAGETLMRVVDGLEKVIRGKRRFLEDLVAGLAAQGHVLVEDIPGLGKTTVAKALARLVSAGSGEKSALSFKRIQFTPDLLPYDITGIDIFDPETRRFSFSSGPVFANILLADEINRTSPKVQSALLEAMAEGQVTVGNKTHILLAPFFVIATQNPIETEGTYPLPAAQLDRFLLRLSLGYPDESAENEILRDEPSGEPLNRLEPTISAAELAEAQAAAALVFCDEGLSSAVVKIARAIRNRAGVRLGVSPRGSLMLLRAARARALIQGRNFVEDQDIIDMAEAALAHRIILDDPRAQARDIVMEASRAALESIP